MLARRRWSVAATTQGHAPAALARRVPGTGDTACIDINECNKNNGGCTANETCNNTPGSRTCTPTVPPPPPPGGGGGGGTDEQAAVLPSRARILSRGSPRDAGPRDAVTLHWKIDPALLILVWRFAINPVSSWWRDPPAILAVCWIALVLSKASLERKTRPTSYDAAAVGPLRIAPSSADNGRARPRRLILGLVCLVAANIAVIIAARAASDRLRPEAGLPAFAEASAGKKPCATDTTATNALAFLLIRLTLISAIVLTAGVTRLLHPVGCSHSQQLR